MNPKQEKRFWSADQKRFVYSLYMLFMDTKQHNKPHVHVYYGDYEAAVGIDGELLAGALPKKQLKMVVGWLAFHEEEAYKAWNLAVRGEHFDKIAPM